MKNLSIFSNHLRLSVVGLSVCFAFLISPSIVKADAFDPGDDSVGGAIVLPAPTSSITTVEPPRTLGFVSSNGLQDVVDFFIIPLTAGTTYIFTSDDPLSNGDPVIEIINADTGALIGSADAGIGLQFFLQVTPPTTGEYYIAITPWSESTPAFTYVMSYFIAPDEGGSPGGGGGSGVGGGVGGSAPIDFVSFSGVPSSITPAADKPSIDIESQVVRNTNEGTFIRVAGSATPGVGTESDGLEQTEIPLASVQFRYRHGNKHWTEWMNAQGLEEWRFRAPLSGSTFFMFEVRVTDANGKTSKVLGVDS